MDDQIYPTYTKLLDFDGMPLVRKLPPTTPGTTPHKGVLVGFEFDDLGDGQIVIVQTIMLTEV
jgi:hypothetical protein